MGCIRDAALFETLKTWFFLKTCKDILPEIIFRCVDIKRQVGKDQFDTGRRMLLNFGHTRLHTIEQYFHYEQESHGKPSASVCIRSVSSPKKKICANQVLPKDPADFECLRTSGCLPSADGDLMDAISLDKEKSEQSLKSGAPSPDR